MVNCSFSPALSCHHLSILQIAVVLIIDNYDSFTYNLAQLVGRLGRKSNVVQNDKITIKRIEKLKPEKIIISPGPCTPKESGISNSVIKTFMNTIPILGVCLGHQCIAHVFGAKIIHSRQILHGKTCRITHDEKSIYKGMPDPFVAMRYNSLTINPKTLPDELYVTSRCDSEVMGIRHKYLPLEGVQFHPESYRTPFGHILMQNFLSV